LLLPLLLRWQNLLVQLLNLDHSLLLLLLLLHLCLPQLLCRCC
jgi:hypothetical protein